MQRLRDLNHSTIKYLWHSQLFAVINHDKIRCSGKALRATPLRGNRKSKIENQKLGRYLFFPHSRVSLRGNAFPDALRHEPAHIF